MVDSDRERASRACHVSHAVCSVVAQIRRCSLVVPVGGT